jgi:multidrug resistance efflux pump
MSNNRSKREYAKINYKQAFETAEARADALEAQLEELQKEVQELRREKTSESLSAAYARMWRHKCEELELKLKHERENNEKA